MSGLWWVLSFMINKPYLKTKSVSLWMEIATHYFQNQVLKNEIPRQFFGVVAGCRSNGFWLNFYPLPKKSWCLEEIFWGYKANHECQLLLLEKLLFFCRQDWELLIICLAQNCWNEIGTFWLLFGLQLTKLTLKPVSINNPNV
jgi:hypothetical protein